MIISLILHLFPFLVDLLIGGVGEVGRGTTTLEARRMVGEGRGRGPGTWDAGRKGGEAEGGVPGSGRSGGGEGVANIQFIRCQFILCKNNSIRLIFVTYF